MLLKVVYLGSVVALVVQAAVMVLYMIVAAPGSSKMVVHLVPKST